MLKDAAVGLETVLAGTTTKILSDAELVEHRRLILSCDVAIISVTTYANMAGEWVARRVKSQEEIVEECLHLRQHIFELLASIAAARKSLNSLDLTFVFDDELAQSRSYMTTSEQERCSADTETTPGVDESDGEGQISDTATIGNLSVASFPTASPSLMGSVDTGGRGRYGHQSFAEVEVTGYDATIELTALLDTGAFQNCVSQSLWEKLDLHQQTVKHAQVTSITLGNGAPVPSKYGVKVRWRFKDKGQEYHFFFYVVDDLAHDMILCGPSIWKYEFLSANPEICALGLPGDLVVVFENQLTPLGLPKLRRSEAQEQQQRADQAQEDNEQARQIDTEEIKRLAEEKKRKIEQQAQSQTQGGGQAQGQSGSSSS